MLGNCQRNSKKRLGHRKGLVGVRGCRLRKDTARIHVSGAAKGHGQQQQIEQRTAQPKTHRWARLRAQMPRGGRSTGTRGLGFFLGGRTTNL